MAGLEVAGHVETAEGPGLSQTLDRLRGAHHGAPRGDGVLPLDDAGHQRTGGDELDQAVEEGFALMLPVVGPGGLDVEGSELEGHECEALAFDAGKNRHTLPAEAGADGPQRWQPVGTWKLLGPFSLHQWEHDTPLLTDAVFDFEARYVVDKERMPKGKSVKARRTVQWKEAKQRWRASSPFPEPAMDPPASSPPRVQSSAKSWVLAPPDP